MDEYCLYGAKVASDLCLFEQVAGSCASGPLEQQLVQLRQRNSSQGIASTNEVTPLLASHGRELFLCTDRVLACAVPGQPWRVEVKDVVSFHWVSGNPWVYYQPYSQGSRQLLAFWFVHIFLPLYLTLERGYAFIHCSAVEVAGSPVLFVAPSMGGKSTLGDYFLQRGHAMLTDDKAATFFHRGKYYVAPSHPHHRPFRAAEVLGNPVERFATREQPVNAFYILERAAPDAEVEICEVEGFRKFEALLPAHLFRFRFLQQQRLQWLAQLADQALVYRLRRPWNLQRQGEVYDAVCEDVQARKCCGSHGVGGLHGITV